MLQVATHTRTTVARVLTPPEDRVQIDGCLATALGEAQGRYASNPRLLPLFARISEFVLWGGKRLRPRLCLASFRILADAGDATPWPVWVGASSLEIFHAFMLVHDDLIDGSSVRRDRAALHEAIRLDGEEPDGPGARKRASDLGLIAGDLLFALGMRTLSHSGLDEHVLARAQRIVADMLFETGLGEALDVLYDDCPLAHLAEEQIVESYLRKTARYSVSGPLVLGASLAGAPPAACEALGRFGDLLGFGYQVQNDLDAMEADPEHGEHSDLDSGKRTFLLLKAYRRLSEAGRRAMDEALAAPVGVERRRRLLALIRASEAVDECRVRIKGLRRQAVRALGAAPLRPDQRRAYIALADLFSRPGHPQARGGEPEASEILAVPLDSYTCGGANGFVAEE